MALTFGSRYPIALQAVTIFIVECIIRKNLNFVTRTILAATPVIAVIILILYLKNGMFETALVRDTQLSIWLSPFYLMNSINIWGYAFFLVPIAFLFPRTYQERYNYTFIAWFIVSLIFWSANTVNYQARFVIQYTPAVYFLTILAIENIMRINLGLSGRDKGTGVRSI